MSTSFFSVVWLLLFFVALQTQARAHARRLVEPRRGLSTSGMRWYEPWPLAADYPTVALWRLAAISWVGVHVSVVALFATTIWQVLRAST